MSLDAGLRALTNDNESREMCIQARRNNRVVDVYYEHDVSKLEVVEGKEVGEESLNDEVVEVDEGEYLKSNANTSTPNTSHHLTINKPKIERKSPREAQKNKESKESGKKPKIAQSSVDRAVAPSRWRARAPPT
ncbi:hypothetical protein PIB30_016227 [Stylosanthes scabra]|uniref:PB1-like domain-containing protein n=1 Tax=Stylosanthes scabra TaxID=79078 RepID=A0ABU6W5G8_9FABA|nr:hypothetical protein [Stylosanthes scabra]